MQPTLDDSPFPVGFDPIEGLLAYLRAHQALRTVLFVVGLLVLLFLFQYPAPESDGADDERAFRESTPFDDETLSDEELAALAEPWDPRTAISLDEYFKQRAGGAS
jgi:hypothetical protein